MNNGWVKTYRKIQDKGWYKDSHYVHLWLHLLLKANHEGKEILWNNKLTKIKRGQFITGRNILAQETGINGSKIERVLKCFKSEQQIEQQTTNKFRLITVKNYDKYQSSEQQVKQPVNNKRTTSEQQVNTNKNYKNEKKDKKDTPSQIAKNFFSSSECHKEILLSVLEADLKNEPNYKQIALQQLENPKLKEVVERFIDYWTEPNKGGTMQLWETKKTFEVGRRLKTWFRNMNKFDK